MRTQRKNSRHTRKQNLAWQYNGCVEEIIIIKVTFDLIRLWPSILGLSHVLLLVPSTGWGVCVGGGSVSQEQHGSPRLDQTQDLYLDSLSLKN